MSENCVRLYEELQQVKVFSMENETGAKTGSLKAAREIGKSLRCNDFWIVCLEKYIVNLAES